MSHVLRIFGPAAAEREIQPHTGLETRKLHLDQQIFCREQCLLRLQHRQKIGDAAERISLPLESLLIPALVLLAILVGIWPAISAYRTDVAKSLGK